MSTSRREPVTRRSPLAGLRFRLEGLILRGLRYRLLLAVTIVVGVAVIAGVLVTILDGGVDDPAEGIWWAFLRLTDPGYLGDDEGVARRAISTVVTVLGYLLFLGLLIAILTQWLNQTIAKLESGVSPVALSDHVLILGWTNQTRAIAESLLKTGSRVERFLSRRGARDLRIVIMAEQVDEALRQRLRERLGARTVGRRVLLRAGTPLRVDHLERAAFRDAAVVILPGAGFAEQNPGRIDSRTIKTLASVSRIANESGAPPPFTVAELFDVRRVDIANRAYDGPSEVIAADALVSRLVAQSVRHRGVWSVMRELFMLHDGNSIWVRSAEELTGERFGDLHGRFSRAILLGMVRSAERRPSLHPDPATLLETDDLLVFLARAYEDCAPDAAGASGWTESAAQEELHAPMEGARRVLILGWSRKVPALLRELARFGDGAFEVDIVSRTSIEAREAGLGRSGSRDLGMKVRQIEAGFSEPGVLENLELHAYDNVVVLASELVQEKEHADAISVVAALTLRGLFADRSRRPEVLVELLDLESRHLFRGGVEDVMVSPAVVSYVVSQVALRRELAGVFWELTRPWGGQILLRPAEDYAPSGGTVRFDDIQRVAAARGEIALGIRRPGSGEAELSLNPERGAEWSLGSGDELVVLTSIRGPEGAA